MTKKEKQNLQDLILALSEKILNFEGGDVIALSEIMQNVEALLPVTQSNPILHNLTEAMFYLCSEELKDERDSFTKEISQAIDFFMEIHENEADLPEWKKNRALDWVHEHYQPEKTPDVPKPDDSSSSVNECMADNEQLAGFISDCKDRFSRAEELILMLEDDLENLDHIKELFRVFHTIKGECGFLKLASLGYLTHNIENLLDLLRSEKMKTDSVVIDYLLRGLDFAKDMVLELENHDVVIESKTILDGYIDSLTHLTDSVRPSIGSIMTQKGLITEKEQREIVKQQAVSGFEKRFGEIAVENKYADQNDIKEILSMQKQQVKEEKEAVFSDHEQKQKQERNDAIIKVRTSKVNYLVDMIGELLISLGQIHQDVPGLAEVRKISKTLQHSSMQLRTESVKILFVTVKRIIRDISTKLNKPINAEFIGDDLEIDRLLIESLEEPLMHLVRNSLDHGIEAEADRAAAGKPAQGTVKISAERRGNNIVISVSDDGKGLDKERIIKKAIEKGMIAEDAVSAMTDVAIYNLIFLPGFSTKDKADLMSGRGVGMDIIKQMVLKAKGRIDTYSTPGQGTTFDLIFPLSTAIIDGMIVRSGPNMFIIPIAVIMESLKVKEENISRIRNGTTVLDLRGEIIPMISLASVFEIKEAGQGKMATIVENSNREKFAIISDEILSKNEIVIKTLGARFRDMKGISSGTVLSGGTIGLVLDVDQFIQMGIDEIQTRIPQTAS